MAKVLRFPALPPVPEPPSLPGDERQRTFQRIAGRLTEKGLPTDGVTAVINTSFGFPASAVDLGALQNMLGHAIAAFDMARVRERWNEDLFAWMRQALMRWIQRCKHLHFDLEENGIRITIETQDDHGYYRYEFDVFPGGKTVRN